MKKAIIIILLLVSVCFGDTYTSHQKPKTDSSLDIGTSSLLWRYLYGDSFTDGTALWDSSSLSGFTSISGTTLTDGVLSINNGSISSAVDGTFSGTVTAEQLTSTDDITATDTITGGTLTDGTFTVTGGIISAGTWQGDTITVPYGGTGAVTLTDGGLLVGSGTSAITALGVASNGQIPIGDGATDPVLATITAVANETDVTNGAGSITIGIVTSPTLDGTNFTGIPDGALDETYLRADGTIDLTGDWTVSANDITLTAGNLNLGTGTAYVSSSGANILDSTAAESINFNNSAAEANVTLKFIGSTFSGSYMWDEDFAYFRYDDDIIMNSTEAVYYNDTDVSVASLTDGDMDFTADVAFNFNTAEDVVLNFNTDGNDGLVTWDQSEDYFKINDDIIMNNGEKVHFREIFNSVSSDATNCLDLRANVDFNFRTQAEGNIIFNFIGSTFSGKYLWDEDSDYFRYYDAIIMNDANEIYFSDTNTSINAVSDDLIFTNLTVGNAFKFNVASAAAPFSSTLIIDNIDMAGVLPMPILSSDSALGGGVFGIENTLYILSASDTTTLTLFFSNDELSKTGFIAYDMVDGGGGLDQVMGFSAANGYRFGTARTTNYLDISDGGVVTMVGTAIVYNELPPTPITAAKLGSTAPTLTTFKGNIEQYTFDATNDYIIGSTEVTHAYMEGTDIHPHIHWATNGTEGSEKAVEWELEYSIADMNGVDGGVGDAFSNAVAISAELAIPANTPDRTHMYTNLADITGTNIHVGNYIVWKLSRIAAEGTAPAADPFGLAVGFHVQDDSLGSSAETSK